MMITVLQAARQSLIISALVTGICVALPGYAFFIDHTAGFDFSETTPGHELGCLALNIYHEARSESLQGQFAIATVTMNRVRSRHYPDTVCEVVWQRQQFSWTHVASRHHAITDVPAWQKALVVAKKFLDGNEAAEMSGVGNATHYHNDDVQPYWAVKNKLIGQVGKHLFYVL